MKAEYNFDDVGLGDFDAGDFLTLSFTEPVRALQWNGEISNIYPTDSSRRVFLNTLEKGSH